MVLHAAGVCTAALTAGLLLAACGGGSGDPESVASLTDTPSPGATDGTGAATTERQDPLEAALEFARCMRAHGIDMPDPSAGGGISLTVEPGDEEKLEEAQKACQPILQNAESPLSEEQQQAMQDAQLAFAKCMREHGIDYPDPQFGENGMVTQQGGTNIDPNDPDFKEAEDACRPIIEEAARAAGLPKPEEGPSLQGSGESR